MCTAKDHQVFSHGIPRLHPRGKNQNRLQDSSQTKSPIDCNAPHAQDTAALLCHHHATIRSQLVPPSCHHQDTITADCVASLCMYITPPCSTDCPPVLYSVLKVSLSLYLLNNSSLLRVTAFVGAPSSSLACALTSPSVKARAELEVGASTSVYKRCSTE